MRCAVLGSPIAHSLSPALHHAAYVELGLDWRYEAVDVTSAQLPDFLQGLDATWRGLSLTMPLKRTVVPLLAELSDLAAAAQAANTVVIDEGRLVGHNTDIPGMVGALAERGVGEVGSVLVLGGGATAASAGLAVAALGCRDLTYAVREPGRLAETLSVVAGGPDPLNAQIVPLTELVARPVDLLVSTIPAGAQDDRVQDAAAAASAVFEVVYDPWPTPVASRAKQAGRTLVSGLDLLVHQALLQVELMTGRSGSLSVMRRAGEEALADRSGSPRLRP